MKTRKELAEALLRGEIHPVECGETGACCVCGNEVINSNLRRKLYTCGGKCAHEFKAARRIKNNAQFYAQRKEKGFVPAQNTRRMAVVISPHALRDPFLVVTPDGYVSNADPVVGF